MDFVLTRWDLLLISCSERYVVRFFVDIVLGDRYHVEFAFWHESSVCRLYVVCDAVAPSQKVGHFGNIFAPSNIVRTRTLCVKISGKKPWGFRWPCKLNGRGMKIWRISTNISLHFENDTAIVTMEDEYETVCDLSNGAISDDHEWHLTYISRSWYYLVSNNSKMVHNSNILKWQSGAGQYVVVYGLSIGTI